MLYYCINLTKLPVNFGSIIVSCFQKPNHSSNFAAGGIIYRRAHCDSVFLEIKQGSTCDKMADIS